MQAKSDPESKAMADPLKDRPTTDEVKKVEKALVFVTGPGTVIKNESTPVTGPRALKGPDNLIARTGARGEYDRVVVYAGENGYTLEKVNTSLETESNRLAKIATREN